MKHVHPKARLALFALAACAGLAGGPAAAQESADIAQVRQTTLKLINLLVEQGVLTRARAEALLAEAARPPAAAAKPATPPAPPPVRVQLVPEIVKKEIRDEVRTELVAQALREGWAGPGTVPEWTRGLRIEGDVRTRLQADDYAADNAPAISVADTNRNRALTLANSTVDRQRLRVRVRLGASVTLDEQWGANVRLTSGNLTDPVSSNQTLGTYGNRFTTAFDRAFIRYRHGSEFSAVFGRFGNPWYGTELLWAPDLGFDGVALQWTPTWTPALSSFVTLGLLPVQEVELSGADKWLLGLQAGAEYAIGGGWRTKAALGYYDYRNTTGKANAANSSRLDTTAPAFAQKGNTYFNISSDTSRPLLALASDFRLVDLTASLELPAGGGRVASITADRVRNLGFDRAAVAARVGEDVAPQVNGFLLRASFGQADIARRGDWQLVAGYKRVERDAVPDAFTDSDLRLGGTDTRGFFVGGSIGLGRNTALGLRYLSGETISGAPFSVDTLQVDLHARF